MTTTCLADRTAPGELLRLVMGDLAGAGLDVRPSELTWTRDYWAEAAAIVSGPEFRGWSADPASVADPVAGTVMRAMSYLRPGGRGGAGHG